MWYVWRRWSFFWILMGMLSACFNGTVQVSTLNNEGSPGPTPTGHNGILDVTFNGTGKITSAISHVMDAPFYLGAVGVQVDTKVVLAGTLRRSDQMNTLLFLRLNADGTPDTSFGTSGMVKVDTATYGVVEIRSIAFQSNGKILLAGEWDQDSYLARLNTDGSFDTGFGINGAWKIDYSLGSAPDSLQRVRVRGDDKIVVMGNSGNNVVVALFNADGTVDNSFGVYPAGTIIGAGSDPLSGNDLVLQPDNRIVVVGVHGTYGALMRFTAAGNWDNSFGTSGLITDTEVAFYGVALDSFGNILAASIYGYNGAFRVSRFLPDGTLDSGGFGSGGRQVAGSAGLPSGVVVQTDGTILVSGRMSGDFAIARFNSNGSVDTAFANAGILQSDVTGTHSARNVAFAMSGTQMVMAGDSLYPHSFYAARFNANGGADGTFGSGGVYAYNQQQDVGMGGTDNALAVAIQADGKTVVGAILGDSFTSRGAIVRYNANGTLDNSFGTGGIAELGYGIVSVATVGSGASARILALDLIDIDVRRLNANGTLDTSFGVGGHARGTFNNGADLAFVNTLFVQRDGKILVGGMAVDGSYQYRFGVVRFNADGTPDTAFGSDGDGSVRVEVGTDFSSGVQAIAQDAQGRIILGGFARDNGIDQYALARLMPDGSLDAAFGSGGRQIIVADQGANFGATVAVQPDGKILIAGRADDGQGSGNAFMARVNADGTLDSGFNGNGKVISQLSAASTFVKLFVQSDGGILTAATVYDGGTGEPGFTLVRYRADGTLDTGYATNGRSYVDLSEGSYDQVASAAQGADGAITLVGSTESLITGKDIGLVRFLP